MTDLNTYRWRNRLAIESSGADREMAWIEDFARDQMLNPRLLADLLTAGTKLKNSYKYDCLIKNLSWYVTMKWPCDSNYPNNEPWSKLLEISDFAGHCRRNLNHY